MAKQEQQDALSLSVLFPNKFLKAEDLKGREWVVQILSVSRDLVAMSGGKREPCVVMSLEGTAKQIIVNRTNAYAMTLLLSPDLAKPSGRDWVKKRIAICSDLDIKGRDECTAIRVAGSPDATPERAAAYARAWKGERKGGELCKRLKRAVAVGAVRGNVPPTEQDDPPPRDESVTPSDDIFKGDEGR